MYITTKENIKQLISKTDAGDDVILNAIALGLTTRFEQFADRLVEIIADRVKYFDIEAGQEIFLLPAFPVSACSVWNDEDRSWNTQLDSGVYTFLGDLGELVVDDYSLVTGAKKLKVQFTGGMAASQTALQTAYPDLEMACRIQGAFLYEKRQRLGAKGQSVAGGNVIYDSKVELLPEVREVWNIYSRHARAEAD